MRRLWLWGAALSALSGGLLFVSTAGAGPVQGQYSMALDIQEASVARGGEFSIDISLDPAGMPAYQGAQWWVSYDPAFVEIVSVAPAAGAPGECNLQSIRPESVLMGCIDLAGPNLNYGGAAFRVRARCLQDSTLRIELYEPETFVSDGLDNQPVHFHGDEVVCGVGGAVVVATPPTVSPAPTRLAAPPDITVGPDPSNATPRSSDATPLAGASGAAGGDDSGGDDSSAALIVAAVAAVAVAAGGGYWLWRRRSGGRQHGSG